MVVSLYDFTGEALKPWAEAGFECYAFDIQHDDTRADLFDCGGSISYRNADLHKPESLDLINQSYGDRVCFMMAFPVCTDLAVSGASWFKLKAERDPDFQIKATRYAKFCATLGDKMSVPYFIENPVSRLATLWRKPDFVFHPYHYGGYIPADQALHPLWPQYIAPRDAYKKKTCLWAGGGFKMPEFKQVDPEAYHGNGYSTAMMKLGGKSMRTKNIRSATPRGFARAVCEKNKG